MKRVSSRALPTTSPGKKQKRNAKVLENVDALVGFRKELAERVGWLIKHSAANGSVPRMAEITGLGINTIRRVLKEKGGTSVDTVVILAIVAGLPPGTLFGPLSESHKSLAKMMAKVSNDMERLQARIGP